MAAGSLLLKPLEVYLPPVLSTIVVDYLRLPFLEQIKNQERKTRLGLDRFYAGGHWSHRLPTIMIPRQVITLHQFQRWMHWYPCYSCREWNNDGLCSCGTRDWRCSW